MNKELVFKKEMRAFDINVDDIKPDEHIFGAIEEAIIKMRNECLIDRLEVVLNNNLIDIKDKITDNRTILGCRVSYADLSKDVSFIVRQDNEPTYEQLQKENKQLQERIEYLERSNNRREDIILEQRQEINNLETQQKEFVRYLELEKDYFVRGCSNIYEDSLGRTRLVNEDIFDEIDNILQKYREIIGVLDEKK